MSIEKQQSNQPAVNAEGVTNEEEKNYFGIPRTWPREISVAFAEELAEIVPSEKPSNRQKEMFVDEMINLMKMYGRITAPTYEKSKVPGNQFNSGGLNIGESTELGYLKLQGEDKITWLENHMPKGMPVLHQKNHYFPWRKIAKFEYWAILNHSQIFPVLAARGGLSVHEMVACISGVNPRNVPLRATGEKTDKFIKKKIEQGFIVID